MGGYYPQRSLSLWEKAVTSKITKLQIIFKTAERCNLACKYCYYFFLGDETFKGRPGTTSRTVIDGLADFLKTGVNQTAINTIDVAFHGGEPMLQKATDFDYACSTLRRTLSASVRLNFLIQTNGVLIDDLWLELFDKHKVQVGISIDGPEKENDLYRCDKRKRGSYKRVVKGLRRLQEAHRGGRLPSAPTSISVVSPEFDYKRVYRHLVDDLDLRALSFLLPDVSHDQGMIRNSTPEVYGTILCDIFDEWIRDLDAGKQVFVRQFARVLRHFKATPAAKDGCEPRRVVGRNQIIVVQSDGDMTIDDSYMPAVEWRQMHGGFNITKTSLKDYLSWPVLDELHTLTEMGSRECDHCRYFGICRSGDLENRYSTEDGFAKKSVYCDGLLSFLDHVVEYLIETGYPADLLEQRLEQAKPHLSHSFIQGDVFPSEAEATR